eukprot:CAMPEP_0202373218 /NCGR_PEP_ID=MMETSP1127-20130417/4275_1 /ASSEMBLY_ACC=CAM_ASM_000462 /TAXON_ID=3047 /ORGANISM="Dunaliella tertiolecta, Strain CCMP1320" /LENGTH=46 /DNA_ID= /DNA_START= /DNA_END= /DNA_ORIENTATION=
MAVAEGGWGPKPRDDEPTARHLVPAQRETTCSSVVHMCPQRGAMAS